MIFRTFVEIISKRRVTFALLVAVFTVGGLGWYRASSLATLYHAQVQITIDPDSQASDPGELARFIAGPEQTRLALARCPQVIEMAATALKAQPDLFPGFQLSREPTAGEWARFLAWVRNSVEARQDSPARLVFSARSDSEAVAGRMVQAVAGALMQYLRGSARALSTEQSEQLAAATHQANQARTAWEQYAAEQNFKAVGPVYERERSELTRSTRELARLRTELELIVREARQELKKVHLDDSLARSKALRALDKINRRAEWITQRIEVLERDHARLAKSVESMSPVAIRHRSLLDAHQTAERQLEAQRRSAGLADLPSPVFDAAVSLGPVRIATEQDPAKRPHAAWWTGGLVAAAFLAAALATAARDALAVRMHPAEPSIPAVLDYEILARIPPVSALTELEIAADQSVRAAAETLLEKITEVRPELRALWITSARHWEGKTTVTLALARAMGAQGTRVLVVDANLHNPALQSAFDLDNQYGLTTLLQGHAQAAEVVEQIQNGHSIGVQLADLIAPTSLENVAVLPAGPPPLEPEYRPLAADLKTLAREAADLADVVLFDGPVLSRRREVEELAGVLGDVLLVFAPGDAAQLDTVSTNYVFHEIRNHIVGAVRNFEGAGTPQTPRVLETATT